MSAGDNIVFILKILVPVVPTVTAIVLIFYFDRPGPGPRTKEGRRAFVKYIFLAIIVMSYYIVSGLWIAGVLSWRAVIFFIPTLLAVAFYLLFNLVLGWTFEKSRPGWSDQRRNESEPGLFSGRREFSRHLIDQYYETERTQPDSKWTLKNTAIQAVRKDKKNPEARYILAKSYKNMGRYKKARKHALAAVELEPVNNTYQALFNEITE